MSFNDKYQRKPGRAHSISFSIAYVRVTEWANGEIGACRPKPDILQKALVHAEKLGDAYLIEKIYEAQALWESVDRTPTPRDVLPPTTLLAVEEAGKLLDRLQTQPYAVTNLSEGECLDIELDRYLQAMELG